MNNHLLFIYAYSVGIIIINYYLMKTKNAQRYIRRSTVDKTKAWSRLEYIEASTRSRETYISAAKADSYYLKFVEKWNY